MTYHRKKMMDLSDIRGHLFTCKECGVSVSLPHDAILQRGRLDRCPTCLHPWLQKETHQITAFDEFRDALIRLQRVAESSGFNFALELAPEPEDAARAVSRKD